MAGILTPQDNFSGRSTTRHGVGEVIDLSVNFTPANPIGWRIASGGGTLVNGTNGSGTYTAPARASTVTLELVESTTTGAATTMRVLSTHTFDVIEPDDAHMIQQPSTGIRHTNGFWDVGFLGEAFLRPMDVSFKFIQWREGSVAAVATGYLAGWNGLNHPVGSWMSVAGGNSGTGSKVNMFDTIYTGQLSPPFGNGMFIWAIPWQFRVGSSAAKTFTTANHIALALDFPSIGIVGRASISKKGAGPFTRDAADPTSSH